jgi:hypothetical protein
VDEDFVKDKLDELISKISALRSRDELVPMVSFGYSFYYRLMGDKFEDALIKADEQAYVYKSQRKIFRGLGRIRYDKVVERIIHGLGEAYSVAFTYNPQRELCCFLKKPEGVASDLQDEIRLKELTGILYDNDIAAECFLKNMSYDSIKKNTKNEEVYNFLLERTHGGKTSIYRWQVSSMDETGSFFLVVETL